MTRRTIATVRARGTRIAVSVLLLLGVTVERPLAQQVRDTRGAPAAAAPSGTGAIGGMVTGGDGSQPVRFAYLVLIGTGTGTVKVSSSDAEGRFLFASLPADRYTIGASKPPYLGTVAGARRPGRPGTPIALADGQKIGNVTIQMPLGSAISGAVSDERGQPAAGAMMILQRWSMQNGERTLVSAGSASADDRGRYRFFALLPGEYVVGGVQAGGSVVPGARKLTTAEVDAALKGRAVAEPPPLAGPARPAPVYFPGTPRASDALSIAVGLAEERANVDFRMTLVQTARVEGIVIGDSGPVTGGMVSLVTTGAALMRTGLSARIGPDGRFVFQSIPPGTYSMVAPGTGPTAGQYAQTMIDVNGVDVLGVQLTMQPTLSLSGRLEFRGAAPAPALVGRRIPVRQVRPGASGTPGPSISPTTPEGRFTIGNLFPGSYLIGGLLPFGPTTDSMTWALESVTVDGRDMTDLPIEIAADKMPREVVVTFGDRFQELSGRITRATGAPAAEHTIIVFPEDKTYWVTGSRRIVTTRPGTDGRFTLSGPGPTTLPPGRYRLAAVTDIDRDEQFDPSFLAGLVPASVPITLQPGDQKVQDLVVK